LLRGGLGWGKKFTAPARIAIDICLPIEAIAYFASIVKLLLKIKLGKLGVFRIWQL